MGAHNIFRKLDVRCDVRSYRPIVGALLKPRPHEYAIDRHLGIIADAFLVFELPLEIFHRRNHPGLAFIAPRDVRVEHFQICEPDSNAAFASVSPRDDRHTFRWRIWNGRSRGHDGNLNHCSAFCPSGRLNVQVCRLSFEMFSALSWLLCSGLWTATPFLLAPLIRRRTLWCDRLHSAVVLAVLECFNTDNKDRSVGSLERFLELELGFRVIP